jgi:hypothetical protein
MHTCEIGAKTIWESWKLGDGVGIVRSLQHPVSILLRAKDSHGRKPRTSITPPSLLVIRSPAFGFLPRTAISLRSGIKLSRMGTVATVDLASAISGAASGGSKLSRLRALRCRLAFGCGIPPSFDRGRCLRLEERTEPVAAGTLFGEGENMLSHARK